MLSVKPLSLGELRGVMYDMTEAGDVIAKHVHGEADNHITIVARGRVRVFSAEWSVEAEAGKLLDFRPHEPHTIEALEANSRIFNFIKKPSLTNTLP